MANTSGCDAGGETQQRGTTSIFEATSERPAIRSRLDSRITSSGTESLFTDMTPSSAASALNRRDLAQWLMSDRNPLTARVVVNRMWQEFFGRGLVDPPDDFGLRGSLPSHPELLDWLAFEFRNRGWSQKALHRLIVLSATYRQSSDFRADVAEMDPQNVLLARQMPSDYPRIRFAMRR